MSGRRLSLLAVLAFFGAWELVCRAELVSPVLLSAPSRVAAEAAVLVRGGALWGDLGYTVVTFGAALAIAVTAGTAVGATIGLSRAAYHLTYPFVAAVNALPKVVLMPLVILWVGVGAPAAVLLGAVMASFPILTAVFSGVRALERDYVRVARSFGASRGRMLSTIVVPGVLPHLLSGLRVGVHYALVGVLIAEFFGASEGLGYRMMLLMANFEVAGFFVYLLVVAGMSAVAGFAVHAIEGRALVWRPEAFATSRDP